jgi:peptidoglycan-N-acetylglucosamine deacetylase
MRIFVINGRKCVQFLTTFAVILGLVFSLITVSNILGNKSLNVFNTNRELPIYSVESTAKTAAITFDCAWGDEDIPNILETLRNENVKATFFIVGQWAEKFPQTVKMIANEGHDIGNHGYSHLRMGQLDKARTRNEIQKCRLTLEQISSQNVDLFRPPYGDYNDNVVKTSRELKCFTIQWNVDSLDWKPGISQGEILDRIKNKINPGSIILFHNDTTHTAKMLPNIINTLKNDGYDLQPVSKLILRENYKIDHDGRQKAN